MVVPWLCSSEKKYKQTCFPVDFLGVNCQSRDFLGYVGSPRDFFGS